jgi:endoglycosylceramidase
MRSSDFFAPLVAPACFALACTSRVRATHGAGGAPDSGSVQDGAGATDAGGAPDAATDAGPGTWHVAGGFVRAPDGRAAILRGVNLAGAHKQAPYFGFQQPPDYARVRQEWGMNTIRFLIIWAAIEPEKDEYDQQYLDGVAERIGWARDAGLHVVLDMHQDVYGEGFSGGDGAPAWTCDASYYAAFKPQTLWSLDYLDPNVEACFDAFWASSDLQDHYANAWRQVAERLAGNDAVVGFDVMNEPSWGSANPGTFEAEALEAFYEKIVAAVRQVAPDWLAFLEPSNGRNVGVPTSLTKFPFPGVVYAPHSYNVSAESGKGFSPSDRSQLISNIAALNSEAAHLGAALWIGEYGGDASDPNVTAYMDANYDGAAAVAAANVYWSYDEGGTYSLLNANGSPRDVLLDVIVRPFPELVAGDPIHWNYDENTQTFTFDWHPDRTLSAPTVISVPARTYPSGYQVECGGCTTHESSGQLFIDMPPPGDPAEVVVHP